MDKQLTCSAGGPFFRRIGEPKQLDLTLNYTGLALEWESHSIPIYHHNPPKKVGQFKFKQEVFPTKCLPIGIKVLEFQIVNVNGEEYLPLESLLATLYLKEKFTRPILDVIREYPHHERGSAATSVHKTGFLAPATEAEGFELLEYRAVEISADKFICIASIGWCPPRQAPIHALDVYYSILPNHDRPVVKYYIPRVSNMGFLFHQVLHRRFPDASALFTPQGLASLQDALQNLATVRKLEHRMAEITVETLKQLTEFALGRLILCKLPIYLAEDLPQMAIECLLQEGAEQSRHPRIEDLSNLVSFTSYLRGIINSKIYALRKYKLCRPLEEELNDELPDTKPNPAQQAEAADLKHQLFARLKHEMPPRHQPTIAAWESEFEHADRVPAVNGRRQYAMEVRQKAQSLAIEIDI